MLKMTMLVENHLSPLAKPGMQPRAGLCILLDDGDSRILFDTGPDETFVRNARLMNEPLSNLSAVVLSHGHYDHIGGVNWLNSDTLIICHPEVVRERYACVRVPGKVIPVKNFRGILILLTIMFCSVKVPTQWENASSGLVKFPSKSLQHMVLPMSVPERSIMCLTKALLSGAHLVV